MISLSHEEARKVAAVVRKELQSLSSVVLRSYN
jgi:hypothetical protein